MTIERAFFRHFWLPFYRRWALWYIRHTRVFRYRRLRVQVPPGIFHPGIFFSTPFFLEIIGQLPLQGKTVLDVGTGSGVLAIWAAACGARASALDLNPAAVDTARNNARQLPAFYPDATPVQLWLSDLFDQLPATRYDYLLVNPPYYAQTPGDAAALAFFAGENWQYFRRFFAEAGRFLEKNGAIYMVLSEDCPLALLDSLAREAGLNMELVAQRKKWGERIGVYRFFE
jgi:release factor glutamine methyltransferase